MQNKKTKQNKTKNDYKKTKKEKQNQTPLLLSGLR